MEFAGRINVTFFHASDGWLDRWKKQYNISFKTVSGEAYACTSEMVALLEETMLPTILSKHKLNQIYNADKFGLFYRLQPNESLHFKNEKCVGGRHSKLRLTGFASANALGKKFPMFVIGKAKSPRCFKNIKHLPYRYRCQKKIWMDGTLLEEWVREIHWQFTKEELKIVLLVDNCPAHSNDSR
ncbi:tigger transposable element-derived protein 4-like [Hydra vulgaris]|uniref:tigger transposable element-derived protein 4-like n=1 Tax=Hydra vulgaris TaxID=6087 RepID=UPI001F5F43CF|nr:tigger transposable element-derived protein 4-like [Hydra vulgaris]